MANLKSGTLIGGNLIWNAGNLPVQATGDNLFINSHEVYTEFHKPTPSEVGAVNKAGDTMTGTLKIDSGVVSRLDLGTNQWHIERSTNTNFSIVEEAATTRIGIEKGGKTTVYGTLYENGYRVFSSANKPTPTDVGALPLIGGVMSGVIVLAKGDAINSFDGNRVLHSDASVVLGNSIKETRIDGGTGSLTVASAKVTSNKDLYVNVNKVYHQGFKPTATDVGAANKVHKHEIADVNGLEDALIDANKVTSVNGNQGVVVLTATDVGAANKVHKHEIADVNGLEDALIDANKVTSVNGNQGVVVLTATDVGAYNKAETDAKDATKVSLTGDQTIEGVKTFSSNPISRATQSEEDNALTRKDYVDAKIKANSPVLMTEAQATAIRNQNKEKYAASGFVHYGKHYKDTATTNSINEGLHTSESVANSVWSGVDGADELGISKIKYPVTHIAGFVTKLLRINTPSKTQGLNKILFPQAPDGKTTYNSVTGEVKTYETTTLAFAAETADIKVVTDRVDMFGLEQWLEVINDDEVFLNCIQYQVTTFGDTGIPTVLSARPKTYFAVYDGENAAIGRCVKWSTLSDVQRKQVANELGANLFVNAEGEMVQVRIRQRTIAGAGNGDWDNVNAVDSAQSDLTFQVSLYAIRTPAQGNKDTPSLPDSYRSRDVTWNTKPETGVFTATVGNQIDATCGYKGECYFLVMGTVSRLNQGLYHVSHNASGSVADNNGDKWYDTTYDFNTTADCFDRSKISYD